MKTENWIRRRLDACALGTLGHAYPDGPLIMVVSCDEYAVARKVLQDVWLGGEAIKARPGMGVWLRETSVWDRVPTTPQPRSDFMLMMDRVRESRESRVRLAPVDTGRFSPSPFPFQEPDYSKVEYEDRAELHFNAIEEGEHFWYAGQEYCKTGERGANNVITHLNVEFTAMVIVEVEASEYLRKLEVE